MGGADSKVRPCPAQGQAGPSCPLVLVLTEATGRSTGRRLSPIRRVPGVHSARPVSRAASKLGTMQGDSVVSVHVACLLLGSGCMRA